MITALEWLAGSRTALIAVVAALVLAVAGAGIQTLRVASWKADYYKLGAEYATFKLQDAQNARDATEKAKTESERRFKAQEKITDETIQQREQAKADLAGSTAAGVQLQKRIDYLTRHRDTTPGNPGPSGSGPAPDATADLLAYMRERVGEAENRTIEFADGSYGAAISCDRKYDSVTPSPP